MGRVDPDHPRLKRFGDKHRDYFQFARYLVDEGDYVVTEALSPEQRMWFRRKACDWALRNNKVIQCRVRWVPAEGDKPAGKAMEVTLLRHYRMKR